MADFIVNSTRMAQPPHPFYPLEANIVGYLANEISVLQLLGLFAAGCAVILGFTLVLVRAHNPRLPSSEKATILWFVLCEFSNTATDSIRMLICGFSIQPGLYTFFSRVRDFISARNYLLANGNRLLCLQPCEYAKYAGSLWAAMEGIRHVRFQIFDLGSVRSLYGDCNCCRSPADLPTGNL